MGTEESRGGESGGRERGGGVRCRESVRTERKRENGSCIK